VVLARDGWDIDVDLELELAAELRKLGRACIVTGGIGLFFPFGYSLLITTDTGILITILHRRMIYRPRESLGLS
jgi:hypothetical protein